MKRIRLRLFAFSEANSNTEISALVYTGVLFLIVDNSSRWFYTISCNEHMPIREEAIMMKIAISARGRTIEDLVDMRFGRTEYFLIADENGQIIDVLDNAAQSATGGAGIAAAQAVLDAGADILITGQLGPNAMKVIKSAAIPAYQAINGTIEDNLKAYASDKLQRITESGPAHAGQS